MIFNTFKEPNFSCKVKDSRDSEYEWITLAQSENQLRDRLQKKGYTVVRIRPYDFKKWKTKAKKASDLAKKDHQKGVKIKFDRDIWSELKIHLFEIFHGKCAYCESKVLHISPGDVEHYRPKRKADEAPDTHPGYYWLAYDTGNLLPCCEECNRARGKSTHFPVKDGYYAHKPGNIKQEKPLLLNPYDNKNPAEHLNFISKKGGMLLGTVEGVTDEGKMSVMIYNLKRPDLVEKRRTEQTNAIKDLSIAYISTLGGSYEKVRSFWVEIRSGTREFSAAALAAVEAWSQEVNSYSKQNLPDDD